MENVREEIMEKCEKKGVKISGLNKVPIIVQGRPLFDFGGVETSLLKKYNQDPDDLFMGNGFHNIALHPNGRIEGLKTVSKQYKLVQHLDAINKSLDHIPDEFELKDINVDTSPSGGKIWATFNSERKTEIKVGDLVSLQGMLQNSCDTSKLYRMMLKAMRLVCTNSMVAPDSRFNHQTVRKLHKGGLNLDQQIKGFFENMEENIAAIDGWKKYTEKQLKAPDLEKVFTQLEVGPRVQEELLNTPLRGGEGTISNLLSQNQLTAWDLYNSFTQRITDSESVESTKIESGIKVSEYFDGLLAA